MAATLCWASFFFLFFFTSYFSSPLYSYSIPHTHHLLITPLFFRPHFYFSLTRFYYGPRSLLSLVSGYFMDSHFEKRKGTSGYGKRRHEICHRIWQIGFRQPRQHQDKTQLERTIQGLGLFKHTHLPGCHLWNSCENSQYTEPNRRSLNMAGGLFNCVGRSDPAPACMDTPPSLGKHTQSAYGFSLSLLSLGYVPICTHLEFLHLLWFYALPGFIWMRIHDTFTHDTTQYIYPS